MIVPDLRGFGDSALAPDGFYDPAAHARDLHALVTEVLGHERCAAAAGDVGGVVIQDLGLRFAGLRRAPVPVQHGAAAAARALRAAGIAPAVPRDVRQAADYFRRQGRDADGLAAELDTPSKRRRYVAQFYGSRFWAAPGTFTPDDVDFMTEPFADADKLRAELRRLRDRARQAAAVRDAALVRAQPVPTLVLYGPEDHVIPRAFPDRCEVAFPSASARSSCRAPATSCSGSARTSSTRVWSTSSPI